MTKLTDKRNYYKPFNYAWCYDAWKKHEQMHWLADEVPMAEDSKDWKQKLSIPEKTFLTNLFRFFTQADLDVAGGYVNNYLPHFSQPEIRMMLLGFSAREAIHVQAYSHLIETLGMPESTYKEFLEYKEMKEKHEFVENISIQSQTKENIALQIATFSAFTEGLQLFSSFAMLMNFPRHGKLKGMGQIITWSLRDETLHFESMIKLFRTYIEENIEIWNDSLKSKIYSTCERMVELEDKFIELSFGQNQMEDLTADDVKKYVRYLADRRLISLGLKGIYKVKKNPLRWLEEIINAPVQQNFFETSVTEYSKGALSGKWDDVWA